MPVARHIPAPREPIPPAPVTGVTITAAELAEALAVNMATADRLLSVASELVTRYAPAAPSAILNEAVLRTAGWLVEQPAAAVTSEATGDISTRYAVNNLSAVRHSGAMALLTAYKVRRGGAI